MCKDKTMQDIPHFLKFLKEFCHQLQTKREGGRIFFKARLMNYIPLTDIMETLKEKLDDSKFLMKKQAFAHRGY